MLEHLNASNYFKFGMLEWTHIEGARGRENLAFQECLEVRREKAVVSPKFPPRPATSPVFQYRS